MSRPAGWSLDELEFFEHKRRPRPEQERNKAWKGLRTFAADFVEAECKRGLSMPEAIDLLIEDSAFIDHRKTLQHWESLAPYKNTRHLEARKRFPSEIFAMSTGLARTLDRGGKTEGSIRTLLRRLKKFPKAGMIQTSTTLELRQRDPLWFLKDRLMPPPIVSGMLASHRQHASLVALDGLLERSAWDYHLISETAAIWVADARKYLVLLASIPDAEASEKVVPKVERFDLKTAVMNQKSLIAKLTDTAS